MGSVEEVEGALEGNNEFEEVTEKAATVVEEPPKEESVPEEETEPEEETVPIKTHAIIPKQSEEDLFEDVGDNDDLFPAEEPKETPEIHTEDIFALDNRTDIFDEDEDAAGIDDNRKDLFGSNTQHCDLFDDDEDDVVESNMQGAIPVQNSSDHDRVPFNTPAVGCALDDKKTTALLNAAAKESAQNLFAEPKTILNGDKKTESEFNVCITSFTRVGDGYSSYIVYTVQTTEVKGGGRETYVQRRFSDFVVLHQLLVENYLPRGVIVPPTPEKNFIGTAKVRFGGNNQAAEDQSQFIRRRKAALERYLVRLMGHHLICKDETLRRFLQEEEPPRPNPNASGIKGFMKNVETMVSKATAKINEVDEWYEDKQLHILELEETLKKLLVVVDNLVANRRDLAAKSNAFAASSLILGEGEDNISLRRAITKLSELENKLEEVQLEQADTDMYTFGETVKDYIALIQSAKAAFDERVKTFSTWEGAQSTLAKKREAKNKATAQGKADRVAQCEEDIKFWETRVERCQEDFEMISKNLKDEIRIFEEVWVKEIKQCITEYFTKTIENQKLIVGHWKEFLPEAKIIN